MTRVLPWALLVLAVAAATFALGTRSGAVRAAEARAARWEDSTALYRSKRDSVRSWAVSRLDSLARARSRVDTAIVVVDRTRERAQAVRDSIVETLAGDQGPLAGAIAAADSACDARIRLCEVRTRIADSTASVWRVRWRSVADLSARQDSALDAQRALISELQKPTLRLFGLDIRCVAGVGASAGLGGAAAGATVACGVGL